MKALAIALALGLAPLSGCATITPSADWVSRAIDAETAYVSARTALATAYSLGTISAATFAKIDNGTYAALVTARALYDAKFGVPPEAVVGVRAVSDQAHLTQPF